MEQTPTRAWLEAFRRGEREALALTYREHADELFAFLRRGFPVGDEGAHFAGFKDLALMENIVQEAFARAFSERARLAYDGIRPYRTYLFSIAKNLVIDELRTHKRSYVEFDEAALAQSGAEIEMRVADPGQSWDEQEVTAVANELVARLEPGEREIFVCRFKRGLSVEATARELGCSEHRVKRTEKSMRKRFFYEMRARGYFEGYSAEDLGVAKATTAIFLLVIGGLS